MDENATTSRVARPFDDLDHVDIVREVPGMFVGDVHDGSGLLHAIEALLLPALDEHLVGRCERIDVTLLPDNTLELRTDAIGYVSITRNEVFPGALCFVRSDLPPATKGRFHFAPRLRIGVTESNALASRFCATYPHGGRRWSVAFERGRLVSAESVAAPHALPRVVVRFAPDPRIFSAPRIDPDVITASLRWTAYVLPRMAISFTDATRDGATRVFRFPDGVADMVRDVVGAEGLLDAPLSFRGEGLDTEQRPMRVEVAVQWTHRSWPYLDAISNGSRLREQGTHIQGFLHALTTTLTEYAHEAKLIDGRAAIASSDACVGICAAVSMWQCAPTYSAATQQKLVSSGVRPFVDEVVRRELSLHFG